LARAGRRRDALTGRRDRGPLNPHREGRARPGPAADRYRGACGEVVLLMARTRQAESGFRCRRRGHARPGFLRSRTSVQPPTTTGNSPRAPPWNITGTATLSIPPNGDGSAWGFGMGLSTGRGWCRVPMLLIRAGGAVGSWAHDFRRADCGARINGGWDWPAMLTAGGGLVAVRRAPNRWASRFHAGHWPGSRRLGADRVPAALVLCCSAPPRASRPGRAWSGFNEAAPR